VRARAAFTIVQNEAVFLPIWLRYYRRYFDRSDLYVLDHASDDGSTANIGEHCIPLRVHRDKSFDHAWLKGTVSAFQAFLLRSYERVLFAEADEFVVADPTIYAGLGDYNGRCRAPLACCTGFEVVHYPDEEPPLRFDRPILAQRKYWHPSRDYSKPLLASVPTSWCIGFHRSLDCPDLQPDRHLFLVHLHRVDYGTCAARHRATAARDWNEEDVRRGRGFQNRLVEGDAAFEKWYFGEGNTSRKHIPDRLRSVL
jgi:hypothetical protein